MVRFSVRVPGVRLRHDLETFRNRLKALEAKSVQKRMAFTEEQLPAMEPRAGKRSETAHPGIPGRRWEIRTFPQQWCEFLATFQIAAFRPAHRPVSKQHWTSRGTGLTLMLALIHRVRVLRIRGTMFSRPRTTTQGTFSESARNLPLQVAGARRDVNAAVSKADGPIADPSLYEAQGTTIDQRGLSADADDRLLKAKEIQRELGVSRATAYRMMTDGTLPTYRFGGVKGRRAMVRVSLRDLRLWLANHRGIALPADF